MLLQQYLGARLGGPHGRLWHNTRNLLLQVRMLGAQTPSTYHLSLCTSSSTARVHVHGQPSKSWLPAVYIQWSVTMRGAVTVQHSTLVPTCKISSKCRTGFVRNVSHVLSNTAILAAMAAATGCVSL